MERKTIFFNAKVKPVKPVNDEFTLCKVYVCALDKNRNLSFIGKEAADDALKTLYNCPVIGHLYEDEQGNQRMGGHDMIVSKKKDGSYYFKSLCVPYGVIPQQEDVHYEEIDEPDGRGSKTYVVADCILWTGRYPELKEAIYSEDCWFGQSMEIGVIEHEPLKEDKNYTNILKYSYSALCLLGKSDDAEHNVEPCFPESKVAPYEFALENEQFTELMSQLKCELASCFVNNGKGGEDMDENEKIVTEQQDDATKPADATEEATEMTKDVDGGSEEENTDGATEANCAGASENFSKNEEMSAGHGKSFGSTYREKRNAIDNALPNVNELDADGNVIRNVWYWVCDFDDEYVFVERSEYIRDSGCTEKKGRFAYTFNDEEKTATIVGDMEEMYVKWLTKSELEQIDAQRAQYEELLEYKANRDQADHKSAIDAALADFSDLDGNEEFANVVAKKYTYETADAIKDACYLVRGKFSVKPQGNKNTGDVAVPIGTQIERSVYEDFFGRYGKKQ